VASKGQRVNSRQISAQAETSAGRGEQAERRAGRKESRQERLGRGESRQKGEQAEFIEEHAEM
jgi:hypothetical protein